MNRTLYTRIEQLLGPDQVDLTGENPVAAPVEIDGLRELMRLASSERVKVMVAGGGTLPSPVSLGDRMVISLAGMNRVREVHSGDFLIVAEAGTTVDRAVEAAYGERLLLPLDITSGDRATLGGVYMTAAVGPYAAGYGPFRDFVVGAKCITAQGELVTFGARTTKNVTGYEITRFLAGTLGLFAIAAELTIRVQPLPERRTMVVGNFGSGARAFEAVCGLETVSGPYKRAEIIAAQGLDGAVLAGVGIEGLDSMVETGVDRVRRRMEAAGAESVREVEPDTFMRDRRRAASEMAEAGMLTLTVPPPAVVPLARDLQERFPSMPLLAHPLLGRIHVRASGGTEAEKIAARVLAVGGKVPTVPGQMIREGIAGMFTPSEMSVARALKRELDPEGILNPQLRLG